MKTSIALIVPMLNEAASLPALLEAIQAQTRRPDEIIFVDSGSTDSSLSVIADWWKENGWPNATCRVESNPGGFPGYNRNIGVRSTSCPWIAFVDCGVYPDIDWLENLLDCVSRSGSLAVFGLCEFSAEGAIPRTTCALSYGVGSEHPVLPASLIHRNVFAEIGLFEEHLRSAEDLKWMALFETHFNSRIRCAQARVHYRHFPSTLIKVAGKWHQYQKNGIKAGLCKKQSVVFALVIGIGLASLFLNSSVAIWSGILYIVLRGVVDPIRRSKLRNWWGDAPLLIFLAPIVALTIDVAKLSGALWGYYSRE